jgi:hypothetical protein
MLVSIAIAASLSVGQAEPPKSLYEVMVAEAAAAAGRYLPADDSNDQVRRMQSADRGESRYFNRPAATRAVYDREWTQCRQIARRLAAPAGDGPVIDRIFTPDPMGGGLTFGGLLDASFSMRRARHDIRRQCLIARGWRMVEPNEAGRQRIATLPRDERNAYLDRMLGADQIEAGAGVTGLDALNAGPGFRRLGAAGDDS